MADVEHRERERSRVWLPIRIRTEAGEAVAVTYDASDKGVLLLAAVALEVGAELTLTFEVPGHAGGHPQAPGDRPHERTARGRVVRAGPNHEDPHGHWPYRIAVALDEVVEALGPEIAALARAHPLRAAER